ncbi:hypothetical protein IAD21_05091 [Abditibacteriota bacterium]|nr:hypothetical protein IAD21_05091 [Abditibacteriota bacterium]
MNLGLAPVAFGNGQTGTLNLIRTGNNVSGTLVVDQVQPQDKARSTKAFLFLLAAGTYQISGTVNALARPVTFSLTGKFPSPIGAFSVTGTVPTTTSTGSYTISAVGQTVSGVYPKIGGMIPTPVPTATTSPLGGIFNLALTQSNTSNFGLSSFQPTSIVGRRSASGLISVGAKYSASITTQSRSFVLVITPGAALKVGDQLTLGPTGLSRASITVGGFTTSNKVTSWNTTGGILEITAISDTSISGKLTNATLQPSLASAAKGTLTFDGTLQADLSPV